MKKPLLFGIILTACVVIVAFVFSLGYPGGMISYWKFDDASGPTALDSADANDGTLINGPVWTSGRVDGALSFDGLDDCVEVPNSANLDITDAITLEAWINPQVVGAWKRVIVKGKDINPANLTTWAYILGLSQRGGVYFALFAGNIQTYINGAATQIPTNTWTHIAGTWDGAMMRIYVNGIEQSEKLSFSGPINIVTYPLKFGIAPHSGVPYAFNGIIDEAAIYNRALSAEELHQHYEDGLIDLGYEVECILPPDDMVSWWPGDGNADDIVGNNDGAVYDAIYVPGKVDKAFSFDGDGDYVEVLDDPTLDITDSITLEAWVKADSTQTGNAAGIITKDDLFSDGRSYNLHLSSASSPTPWALRMRLLTLNNDGIIDGTTDLRDNTWHHVAGTWDGSIMNLYVDGILQNSRSSTGSISITPTPVIIGDFGSSRYGPYGFDGIIDEVEIFNRALSQSEIQAIYLAGSAGKCKFIEVDIDIKPGSDPNSINLSSAGVIPVAILSTLDFNAPEEVNPDTINLAGAKVKIVGKSGKFLSHAEDVNGDGLLDLVCQILLTETFDIQIGDSVAELTAETYDGQSIRGEDAIRIVPDK